MVEKARRWLKRTIKGARGRESEREGEKHPLRERGRRNGGSRKREKEKNDMRGRKKRKGRSRGKAEQPAPGNSPRKN